MIWWIGIAILSGGALIAVIDSEQPFKGLFIFSGGILVVILDYLRGLRLRQARGELNEEED